MSGIAGILRFDSAPIEEHLLRRMTAALTFPGDDGSDVQVFGRAGFGHVALHTTPQSIHEHQPLSLDEQVWITADVCLDNRPDLLRQLTAQGRGVSPDSGDAELILHAYAVWGDDCARHLIGIFAFAIWDSRRGRLLIARDPVGIKRVYFYEQPDGVIFASEIRGILAALNQPPPLNETYLQEFLAGIDPNRFYETVYQGITPVKPTHQILVDDRAREVAYYDWDAIAETRYKTDDEYVEHFSELFRDVLTAQTRSATPVVVETSGGTDSSGIAAMLKHIDETDGLDVPGILLHPRISKQHANVTRQEFLDLILKRCEPWPARYMNVDSEWALKDGNLMPLFDEPPVGKVIALEYEAMRDMRSQGSKVALSGTGGDEVLMGEGYFMPELFRIVPLRHWRREWRPFGKYAGRKRALFYGILVPLLTRLIGLRGLCDLDRQFPYQFLSYRRGEIPPWLNMKLPVCDERQNFNSRFMFSQTKMRLILKSILLNGLEQVALIDMGRLEKAAGIERRYPYLDRRIIDFVMSLPSEMLLRDFDDKWIFRQAMRGLVPEAIRVRPSSGTFHPLVDLGWQQKEKSVIESLLASSQLSRYGWVQGDVVAQEWHAYWNNQPRRSLWTLGIWLNVELWLREWQGLSIPVGEEATPKEKTHGNDERPQHSGGTG
jgi:asparagine synthase (glutamine-hydrolysing)